MSLLEDLQNADPRFLALAIATAASLILRWLTG